MSTAVGVCTCALLHQYQRWPHAAVTRQQRRRAWPQQTGPLKSAFCDVPVSYTFHQLFLRTFREIGSNISFRQDLHYHQDLSSGTKDAGGGWRRKKKDLRRCLWFVGCYCLAPHVLFELSNVNPGLINHG